MKVTRLTLYKLALDEWRVTTAYEAAKQISIPLETNVVRLDSDDALVGWGECCVPQPYYHPTLAPAEREAIKYLAPLVVGADPARPKAIMHAIDGALRGHGPAKSTIDIALWDLHGKARGLPLCDLWGGQVTADLPVLELISAGPTDAVMQGVRDCRAEGYKLFQIKVGQEPAEIDAETIAAVTESLQPGERCWFDANRAWTIDHAMRVISRVQHLAPLIEQPCETYEECATVSRRTGLGLMLDESMSSPEAMIRAAHDGVIDVAVLKLAVTGGLIRQKFMAELGVALSIPMRIENYYGTGVTTAAMVHLAHTLPANTTFGLYDYHNSGVPLVTNPIRQSGGRVAAPADAAPGLGVEIDESLLGDPVAVFEA